MATELVQDFSGGIDNTASPNRIELNQIATASNCWYDTKAVRFRPGFTTTQISVDGRNLSQWQSRAKVLTLNGTDRVFVKAQWLPAAGDVPSTPVYSSNATSFSAVSHNTGTVTTTAGSAVVTGSGTTWLTHLRANDVFRVNARTELVSILSVDGDTQITLTANYSTSDGAGAAYSVYPHFSNGIGNGCSFEQLNNLVYITDGSRTPGNFNGTVFNTSTNFPLAHFIQTFKNYMFAADTTANPSRIFWSTIKTPETWPASNFIDVNPDDGQRITGIFNDGNSLLILKKRSIYRLSGDIFDPSNPTYTLTQIYTPPECLFDSSMSWTLFQGRWVLYGGSGLYEYTGGNAISRILDSDRLTTTFNTTTWAAPNFQGLEAYDHGQQAVTYNGKVWMTSQEAATFETILNIERNGSFWLFTGPDSDTLIFSPFIFNAGGSTYTQLWGLYENNITSSVGTIQLNLGFAVDSTAASFTTRVFQYGKKQRFGLAYLHFKRAASGTINFGYKVDEGATVTAAVDMSTGSGNRAKSPPIMIGRVGQSIQFVVSRSGATDFEIYGIEFVHQDLRQ